MHHADPWDEISRLEKQMEAELLAELEGAHARRREALAVTERVPVDRGRREPLMQ